MAALPLTGHALHDAEMEDHGKFGHTLGIIQNIFVMNRIDLCYGTCSLATQAVAPTLFCFQGIKLCVKYLASHPHIYIYNSNSYDGSNFIGITWSGNQVEDHTTKSCLEYHQDADHTIIINRRRSVSGIIHNLLGIYIFWKVQIQPAISFDSTDGEIRCMHKDVKKTKFIRR